MRILVSGGGTGGHIFPLYAIIQELQSSVRSLEILWVGSKHGPEKDFADRHSIPYEAVSTGKFRRYTVSGLDFGGDLNSMIQNIKDAFRVPMGILQAYFRIADFAPDVIFCKGGYVSLPVAIAGWFLRIPVVIHESDVVPGLSNRIAAKFASMILISFSESKKYFPSGKLMRLTGNPVRKELLGGKKERAFSLFRLSPSKPVILIMGGSLGSSRINQVLMGTVETILEYAQVIHLTGDSDWLKISPHAIRLEPKGYRAFPRLTDNLAHALALADLVITRGGANSLAELTLLSKPMIIIPWSGSAAGHQNENAKIFEKHGAAHILPESQLSGSTFLEAIHELLSNPSKRSELAANTKRVTYPDANRSIMQEILKFTGTKPHVRTQYHRHLPKSV